MSFEEDYNTAFTTWISAVQTLATNPKLSGAAATAKLQVDNALAAWRADIQSRRVMNTTNIDELSRLAASVAEEKETLRQLREKDGTRTVQAASLNPKVTASPYVNILGLRRNFRHNTKIGLIIASSIFGALALGSLGYLVYRMVSEGAIMKPSPILQAGGNRRVRFAEHSDL